MCVSLKQFSRPTIEDCGQRFASRLEHGATPERKNSGFEESSKNELLLEKMAACSLVSASLGNHRFGAAGVRRFSAKYLRRHRAKKSVTPTVESLAVLSDPEWRGTRR
jgi:hypothetical protein